MAEFEQNPITVSAPLQPHSWIEPHPFEKLIQLQSKADIETIKPQLKYNPSEKEINYKS